LELRRTRGLLEANVLFRLGAILLFPFLFLQVLLGLPLGLPPRDDEMVVFAVALQVAQQFRGETLPWFTPAPCPKAFLEGRLYLYQGDKIKAQAALEHARTLAENCARCSR
jgi:hypothetical protein